MTFACAPATPARRVLRGFTLIELLVILVIIGLISLVNWLMQKSAEKREAAKMKREQAQEDWGAQPRRNIYTQPAPAPAARRAPQPAVAPAAPVAPR